MKKFLILTLSLLVALSCTFLFVGCADNGDGKNEASGSPSTTATPDNRPDKQKATEAVMGAGIALITQGTVANATMELSAKGADGAAGATEMLFAGRIDLNKIEDITAFDNMQIKLSGDVRESSEVADENAKKIGLTYINSTLYLQIADSKISLEASGIQSVINAVNTLLPQPVAAGVTAMSAVTKLFSPVAETEDIIKSATYEQAADGTVTTALTLNLGALDASMNMDITAKFVIKDNAFVSAEISDLELSGKILNVTIAFTAEKPSVATPEGEFGDVTPVLTALANTVQKKYFDLDVDFEFYLNLSTGEENSSIDINSYKILAQILDNGDTNLKINGSSKDKNDAIVAKSETYFDGKYMYLKKSDSDAAVAGIDKILANDIINAPATVLFTSVIPSPTIKTLVYLVSMMSGLQMGGSGLEVAMNTGDITQLIQGITSEKTTDGTKLTLTLNIGTLLDMEVPVLEKLKGDKLTITLITAKGADGNEYLQDLEVNANIKKEENDAIKVDLKAHLNINAQLAAGTSVLDGLNKEEYTNDLSANAAEAAKTVNAQIDALPEVGALTKEDFDKVKKAVNSYNGVQDELTKAYLNKQKLVDCIARMKELWAAEVKTNLTDAMAKLFPAYDGTDGTLPTAEQLLNEATKLDAMKSFYASTAMKTYKSDTSVLPEEVKNSYEKLAKAYQDALAAASQQAA